MAATGIELAPVRTTERQRRPSRTVITLEASELPFPKTPARVYLPSMKDIPTPPDHSLAPSPAPSEHSPSYLDLTTLAVEDRPGSDDEAETALPRHNSDLSHKTMEREMPALPPVDTGRQAWSFLVAATIVETVVWGIPWSVGVLHVYWSTEMFPDSESVISTASTFQTALCYCSAALLGPFFTAYPQWEKQIQYLGLIVATVGLISSAFVTQAWQLILTIGFLYSFSGALYLPCATLIYEWFQVRRGLATGIMFAGTGVGGTVFPFIVSALLKTFGYKATMLSLGLAFAILNSIALLFIKRRIPVRRTTKPGAGSHARRRRKIDLSFFKKRAVWVSIGVILMTAMGNFIPSVWIPTFAEKVNAVKPNGTALVALMNAASVPGNALSGFLSDRFPSRVVIPLSCGLATLSCLVLWGMGTTDNILVGFSIVWGFTALSFVGMWAKMITIISKDDPVLPPLLFSGFTILKGIGNLTSGPISTALLQSNAMRGAAGAYGNTNYGMLVIYTAITTFVGGTIGLFFPVA